MTAPLPPLIEAQDLRFAYEGGPPLWRGLSFAIRPGLTLVQGDESSGKSTLLRLLAGTLQPTGGRLLRQPHTLHADDPTDPADDEVPVQAWLATRRARHPAWDDAAAQALLDGFALGDHLGKRMAMLSTGSRRKVNLVAAAAGGATLTLLDTPFAALDAPSSRRLAQVLAEGAARRERAWVIADYALPAPLSAALAAGAVQAAVVSLDGAAPPPR